MTLSAFLRNLAFLALLCAWLTFVWVGVRWALS
jgi:hypothetical protein